MSLSLVLPLSLFFFLVLLQLRSIASASSFAATVIAFIHQSFAYSVESRRLRVCSFVSASSATFRIFVFSHFCFIVVASSSHAMWKVAVGVLELLSATTFTFRFFLSFLRLCPTSRLLTVVATSFLPNIFSIYSSTSDLMSWYLWYLRDPL